MAERKQNTAEEKQLELKRLFEGESCALSYNDDDDWFDDEDEEFEFTGSNKWFEDALSQGLKELEMMQRGCVKRASEEESNTVKEKVLRTKQIENIMNISKTMNI
jgi:hypothetical protein